MVIIINNNSNWESRNFNENDRNFIVSDTPICRSR